VPVDRSVAADELFDQGAKRFGLQLVGRHDHLGGIIPIPIRPWWP
jgi:hypothetical protein